MSGRLSLQENEQLLRCAVAVMLADGVIDPKEKHALKKMAKRRGIAMERLQQLIDEVQTSGSVDVPQLVEMAKNREFLIALVRMCLADGNVVASERDIIKSLVANTGYSDVDIDIMINQERARLYAESKQLIKEARRSNKGQL
jgi:tellurite resistance protein